MDVNPPDLWNCGRNRPRILPQNPMDRENKRAFSHRGREAHHSHRAAATAAFAASREAGIHPLSPWDGKKSGRAWRFRRAIVA